jgi:hypothetical protein
MYTRLSAYQLAVLHGIYPKPHKSDDGKPVDKCDDGKPVVWVYAARIFESGRRLSEDIALFRCRCGRYGFITRSKIEDIIDPHCTMRPWVKEQRDKDR